MSLHHSAGSPERARFGYQALDHPSLASSDFLLDEGHQIPAMDILARRSTTLDCLSCPPPENGIQTADLSVRFSIASPERKSRLLTQRVEQWFSWFRRTSWFTAGGSDGRGVGGAKSNHNNAAGLTVGHAHSDIVTSWKCLSHMSGDKSNIVPSPKPRPYLKFPHAARVTIATSPCAGSAALLKRARAPAWITYA